MRARGRPLAAGTRRFVSLLRTSPALTRMAQRVTEEIDRKS
jgi:hypothetical protein